MKRAWKVVVRVDGRIVDTILCLNRHAAVNAVKLVLRNGLEVYSIGKAKSIGISMLKIKKESKCSQ